MAATAPTAVEYGPKAGILAPFPAAERGVAVVLSVSPDGQFIAYPNGTTVVVRSIQDPALCFAYSEHSHVVKVARFAPTGKYIASGDASGKVRVWAFTNADHPLKYELPSIGGEVEDIVWDSEAKRILAVGAGSQKAKFFSWDTGSQLGEVIPHSKKNLTADFKPTRPFKAVIGGEDFSLSFYGGPPFRYEKSLKEHTNFVNCVKYAPDGARFISVSSDKTGIVYDGTTGAVIGRLDPAHAHAGSIYAVAWSPDGTQVATASGDKSVKIWNMTADTDKFPCVQTISLGKNVEDMQQGLAWAAPDLIISLSLDGTLNYVKPGKDEPMLRLRGNQAAATFMELDLASGRIYTADQSGRTCMWIPVDGARTIYTPSLVTGEVATKKAAGVAAASGELAIVAWDDKLRMGDAGSAELKTTIPLPGQPKGVAIAAAAPAVKVVATGSAVLLINSAAVAATTDAPWNPTCVDISADGSLIAVGGKDKKIHFFKHAGGVLTADGESKEFGGEISVVRISPDGTAVAAGDGLREVRLYSTGAAKEAIRSGRWLNHTTRVTGLRWAPNGRHIASVSTDRRLCIWDPASDIVKLSIDLAHPQPFADVAWADDNTVWTLGTDGIAVRRVLAL